MQDHDNKTETLSDELLGSILKKQRGNFDFNLGAGVILGGILAIWFYRSYRDAKFYDPGIVLGLFFLSMILSAIGGYLWNRYKVYSAENQLRILINQLGWFIQEKLQEKDFGLHVRFNSDDWVKIGSDEKEIWFRYYLERKGFHIYAKTFLDDSIKSHYSSKDISTNDLTYEYVLQNLIKVIDSSQLQKELEAAKKERDP